MRWARAISRAIDRIVDGAGAALGPMRFRDQRHHAVAPDQVVVERDEEARGAGIALPAGAAAQLMVDALALVPVGADHVEAAERGDGLAVALIRPAEPDVGAAAGHVRRDRDRAERAGPGDDLRFVRILARVQHVVRHAAAVSARDSSSDSRTLAVPTRIGRPVACTGAISSSERRRLRLAVREDDVGLVDAGAGAIGREDDRLQAEEHVEFVGGRFRRGRHAGERRVLADEVLHRIEPRMRPSARMVTPCARFLGFDRRLNAVRPAAVLGDAPGPFVDQLHHAVADDVVAIAAEQRFRVQRDVHRTEEQMRRQIVQAHLLLSAVHVALHAEALLQRDRDYVVRDGRVEIVDEWTGRVAENRRWPNGIQPAVEAKEGGRHRPREGRVLGSMPMQHFMRLYTRLSGMTATAESAAEEFAAFFGLKTVVFPPNRTCHRVDEPDVVFATARRR